jgi:hypothetical protein
VIALIRPTNYQDERQERMQIQQERQGTLFDVRLVLVLRTSHCLMAPSSDLTIGGQLIPLPNLDSHLPYPELSSTDDSSASPAAPFVLVHIARTQNNGTLQPMAAFEALSTRPFPTVMSTSRQGRYLPPCSFDFRHHTRLTDVPKRVSTPRGTPFPLMIWPYTSLGQIVRCRFRPFESLSERSTPPFCALESPYRPYIPFLGLLKPEPGNRVSMGTEWRKRYKRVAQMATLVSSPHPETVFESNPHHLYPHLCN